MGRRDRDMVYTPQGRQHTNRRIITFAEVFPKE